MVEQSGRILIIRVLRILRKDNRYISDAISKDLAARGMKFVGSVIIYSYLQAIGVIYSHEKDCFMYV